MKLLIITQKVDIEDPILGFFHRWILEFAKHCEKVIVICLQKGKYEFPKNVKVVSLGKEDGGSKIKYIYNFYKTIIKERKEYDCVFVHMNQIYVILGGFVWKIFRKRISLWYTHKSVTFSLNIAEKIVDRIFSASKESFRLKSNKIMIFGHGIDTDYFIPRDIKKSNEILEIISVGRISPIKNQLILLDVANELLNIDVDKFIIKIIGSPITELDEKYFRMIKSEIKEKIREKIIFVGSVSPQSIVKYYQDSDIFINLSDTGSIDKVVLEAMSVGINVLTSNTAFSQVLSNNSIVSKNPKEIAEKIMALSNKLERGILMRQYVVANHGLKNLIIKIVQNI